MMSASILSVLRGQNERHIRAQESALPSATEHTASASVPVQMQLRCCQGSEQLCCLSRPYLRDHLSAFHKASSRAVLLTLPCFESEGLTRQHHVQQTAGVLALLSPARTPHAQSHVPEDTAPLLKQRSETKEGGFLFFWGFFFSVQSLVNGISCMFGSSYGIRIQNITY